MIGDLLGFCKITLLVFLFPRLFLFTPSEQRYTFRFLERMVIIASNSINALIKYVFVCLWTFFRLSVTAQNSDRQVQNIHMKLFPVLCGGRKFSFGSEVTP